MARDRKRSKQRRDRGTAPVGGAGGASRAAERPEEELEHPDVPGELLHASADADEFDAALLRGSGGLATNGGAVEQSTGDADDELLDGEELALGAGGSGAGRGADGAGGGRGGDSGSGPGAGAGGDRGSGAPIRDGNRALGFLRASWAELQRVQWPDRQQVTQATAVVLGFVAVAGAYLGVADYVAKEIVEFIL